MRIHAVAVAVRRAQVQWWLIAPLIAALLVGVTPRAARADEVFKACLAAADQWYADCAAGSGSWWEDAICQWVGGALLIICVIIGFIEKLVDSML